MQQERDEYSIIPKCSILHLLLSESFFPTG
jgi:hypothetical protein